MKNYTLAILLAFATLSMHSQVQLNETVKVSENDVIEIGNPSSKMYKHIKLPRGNFVGTKNGFSDYKSALGNEVVVTEVKTINKGMTIVSVKRKDGKRFFNTVPTLNISLEKALNSNEIKLL